MASGPGHIPHRRPDSGPAERFFATPAQRTAGVVGALSAVVLLCILGALVDAHSSNRLDVWFLARRSNNARALSWANDVLDVAGSRIVIPLVACAYARLAWWRWRSLLISALPVVSAFGAWLLAEHVLKQAFTRHDTTLIGQHTYPSGTMAVVSALGLSGLLLLRLHHGRLRFNDAVATILPLTVVVGCLVLTGYHTATDMIGGILLGVAVALAAAIASDALRAG